MKLPGLNNKTRVITGDHNTGDIIELVLNEDGKFQDQTNKFTSKLQGLTVYDQCKYIWQTLRDNVTYKADTPLNQELKSPARLFADGIGDCKSFSLFEASCLRNLGIPYCFRFVSFRPTKTPTHVYIVAMPGTANAIIMDGVLPTFDYQKPFTYKYDVAMLSMLTGVDLFDHNYVGANIFQNISKGVNKAAQDLKHSMQVNAQNAKEYEKDPKKLAADAGKTVNKVVQGAIQIAKTIAPPLILVRSGYILAMESNFMNVASKIKLGLYTPAQAQAKGYNMTEWYKLQAKTNSFIKGFTDIGGNRQDLINAILKGGGQLNGIGCPSMSYMGAAQTDVQKTLAAVLPVIVAFVKDLIGIDFTAIANKIDGADETNAQKASTINSSTMNDITAGASALADMAAGAVANQLNKGKGGGPGTSTNPGSKMPGGVKRMVVPKKSSFTIPLLIGGAAALYFLTKNK